MPERRIPRDPSPEIQGRTADGEEVVRGRGGGQAVVSNTDPSPEGTPNIVVSSSGTKPSTARHHQQTEIEQQQQQQGAGSSATSHGNDPPPVAPGAVPATNQTGMADYKCGPDFKAQVRPMFDVSDQSEGASRLGQEMDHLPRLKNQVQTVLGPVDVPPVDEIPEKSSDLVTFKDQHRPHELEHDGVPPSVPMVPAGQQHQSQRENQSQRNPLGEDALFEPGSNGITHSSQHQENGDGHLPSDGGGGGGSNTSGLRLQAQAADTRLEDERLQCAVRRELQSRPPIQAELMEKRCSRRSTRIITLLTTIIVIIAVTIGTGLGVKEDGSGLGNSPTSAMPSPDTVDLPGPTNTPVSISETPSAMPVSFRAVAITKYINKISFSSPIEYPLPPDATPEEMALDWLINEDPLQLTLEQTMGNWRLSQRFALLTFWFSTNGPEWANKNGWLDDQNECNWQGIACEEDVVFSIGEPEGALQSNNCRGSIPADLALLSSCALLNLGRNQGIGGSMPKSLTALTKLQLLYLNGCQLTGAIPEDIGKLRNLTLLNLSNNLLTGTLPDTVGNFSNLIEFDVANNRLMGTLGDSIGNWQKLWNLYIFTNRFSGSLPSTISSWSDLQYFSVYDNQFKGTIPPVNWTMLQQFDAHGNAFSGTLSESIGSFSKLRFFTIDGNRFTGTLPSSIGLWTDLQTFRIAGSSPPGNAFDFENRFEGTLPDSIGAWSLLSTFLIGIHAGYLASVDRTFTGPLPASIANWTSLQLFGAFNHQFTGSLPPDIGTAWSQMEGFNVANNSLTGNLPEAIGQWVDVGIFSVRDNWFTGTIPQSIANWTNLQKANFYHNNFTGTIPSAVCEIPTLEELETDCLSEMDCSCCTCFRS